MVTQAVLHRFTYQQNDVLKYITTRCKHLNTLLVPTGFTGMSLLRAAPFAKNLKTLVVTPGCEITLDTVSQILAQCNELNQAEFPCISRGRFRAAWSGDMTNLRILTLNASRGGTTAERVFDTVRPRLFSSYFHSSKVSRVSSSRGFRMFAP